MTGTTTSADTERRNRRVVARSAPRRRTSPEGPCAPVPDRLAAVDSDDTLEGVPQLDRQERPLPVDAQGRRLVPQRVPESKPTPLQDTFIYFSIVVLVCGVIAIMALELGTPMSSLFVKVPVLIGGVVLLLVTADALLRVWRSVSAWWPVDRGRALFRVVWAAVLVASLVAVVVIMLIVGLA